MTIHCGMQCPYILKSIEIINRHGESNAVPVTFIQVDRPERSRELPCAFNHWGVFYKEKFEAVNPLDVGSLKKNSQKIMVRMLREHRTDCGVQQKTAPAKCSKAVQKMCKALEALSDFPHLHSTERHWCRGQNIME